jgi:hypothetical protein
MINMNSWEELIACFPLIRHGSHRKRRLRQFFVPAGTSLPSCYLAKIRGYTDRPTDSPLIRHGSHRKWRFQQFLYCCRCLAKKGGLRFPKPLSSNDRRDAHTRTDTQIDVRNLWSMPLGWDQMPWYTYTYVPSFIKIGSDTQKLLGGYIDTQRGWRSHKPVLGN